MNNHCGKNKFHKAIMMLCCAMPIVVLGALYIGKAQGTSWGSILSFSVILLCPLMHLIMMPILMRRNKKETSEENKSSCH